MADQLQANLTRHVHIQGTVILSARDMAFSTVPGRASLETPNLAGSQAALVVGIQVLTEQPSRSKLNVSEPLQE